MAVFPVPSEEVAPRPARPAGPVRAALQETGDLVVFGWDTLRALPGTLRYFSEVLRLAAIIVRRTSFLMFAMNVFLGFSVATFGFFLLRSIGAGDAVGVVTGLLTQRQVTTTMFGYVIAASVCCGFAAEIGAAKIQQEIDAYSTTGIDPREFIVGARLMAVILFLPLAAVLALIGQFVGNFLDIVVILQGNSAKTFMTTTFSVQSIVGQVYVLITMFFIAVPCVIVACFYGMRTTGGPASVGAAVAKSLTVNLVLVHLLSAFFGVFFYSGNLQIPVGG